MNDLGARLGNAQARARTDSAAQMETMETENARLREQLAATQHRVRNTLAVIRSIARRSAETSENVEDYAMHLDGRIGAFARVQGALLRDPGEGMALETLVADALVAVLAREGERWTLEGPPVVLKPKAAEMLALALHELGTNAVKFGALSWPRGRIAVSWALEGGGQPLVLTWAESGAPGPVALARSGFGRQTLERTLAYELGAEVSLACPAPGLLCRIALPMNAVNASAQS